MGSTKYPKKMQLIYLLRSSYGLKDNVFISFTSIDDDHIQTYTMLMRNADKALDGNGVKTKHIPS